MTGSLSLLVGSPIQLDRLLKGGESANGTVIGCVVGKSVMVSWPTQQGNLITTEVGEEFVAKISDGDANYAFRTSITHLCQEPFPYVHLEYPGGVVGSLLRRGHRVPVDLPTIRLSVRDGPRTLAVTMLDVSQSGARLVAPERLGDVGEIFTIEMRIRPGNERVTLPCNIRYVLAGPSGVKGERAYYHGVEFKGMDGKAQGFVERLINDALTKQRRAIS